MNAIHCKCLVCQSNPFGIDYSEITVRNYSILALYFSEHVFTKGCNFLNEGSQVMTTTSSSCFTPPLQRTGW